MTNLFNVPTLLAYEKSLGKAEILELWRLFVHETENTFSQIQTSLAIGDVSALRTCYHRLHPAAKVFGLDSFAFLCAKIEHNLVNSSTAQLKDDIQQSFSLWQQSFSAVALYLECAS